MGNVYSTIVSGFNRAVSFITGLASSAFRWGADLINGIVNGIRSCIGNVVSAVSDVANAIRSHLHFSVPDEGALTDYENWMPDFMKGLAQGIEKSRGLVKQAVEGVAADMVISPKVSAMETAQMQVSSMDSIRQMVSGIREMFAGMQNSNNMGTICIPVTFSVSPKWLKLLTGFKQKEKITVKYFDTETLEIKQAEMFIEGYKASLVKDTSYKGLWKVSFTLQEF